MRQVRDKKEKRMKLKWGRYGCFFLIMIVWITLCGCSADTVQQKELPELVIGGTLYSPYFYRDINGQCVGIDVDVAEEACRRIGYTPVFQEIDIADRFDALQNEEVDCLWSCLTMKGREEEYLWAGPYLYTQRVIMVPVESDIKVLNDLEGKRAAVLKDSTSETIIVNQEIDYFPKLQQLTSFSELSEVFMALRKGYVDAAIGHESSLLVYADEYPGEYRFLNISLRSDALGVAFRTSADAEMVEKLNGVMQEMQEDGTLETIIEKYDLDIQKNVYGGSVNGQEEK